MNVRITQRDRDLFRFIYENAYVTAPQIQKAIFLYGNLLTAHQRLFRLVSAGYLYRIKCDQILYKLTPKSLCELVLSKEKITQYQDKRVIFRQVHHDVSVVDCRQLLEKFTDVQNWIPAHRLRTSRYSDLQYKDGKKVNVPDAIFEVKRGSKVLRAAFEFERVHKNKSRYYSLIENYHLIYPIDLVFYVVKPKFIKPLLLDITNQILEELRRQKLKVNNRLFVTTFDELKNSGASICFNGAEDQNFSFKETRHSKNP